MWSKQHDCCVVCGTTAVPFMAVGKCRACYLREYRGNNGERIASQKKIWYEAHRDPERQRARREARNFSGVRQQVLARDAFHCVECRSNKNLIVHHKDGNGRGSDAPNNDIGNLITLCRACHARHHSRNVRWSRHHDHCVTCKRTDRKHNAKGLCWSCYLKQHPSPAAPS